ncbi:MAG TPA: type II toxin-antitoxin system VapC family toxin [Terriglobales bacterium]|nr:type II toxin-antitoxin system VapC family toxin [Terriglobales bacterium]
MKYLLDSHVVLWWLENDPALSSRALRLISSGENEIFISTVTAWELAIKNHSGKLEIEKLLDGLESKLIEEGFFTMTISMRHALRAGALPSHHKDPFDRMLIAQAQAEDLSLISNDSMFDHYGVRRIW